MYITEDLPLIKRYAVIGSRRFSTIAWGITIFLSSIGFLIVGISSYGKFDFGFFSAPNIVFIPQGILMCFYGIGGLFFSCRLGLTAWWDVGGGYNEFNIKGGYVKIVRWGFPGKNRRIIFIYEIKDINSIRVELKDGLNPRRNIYMRVIILPTNPSGNGGPPKVRDILLTGVRAPLPVEQVEIQAFELSMFLNVPLEYF